jgi:protein-tyrosine phosphatase
VTAPLDSGGIDRVLLVCSANQCRSALAGVLLVAQLQRIGLDLAVESAGVQAVAGRPATSQTVAAAASMGLDLSAHRSQLASRAMIAHAGLILTMERAHVRQVVVTDPQAFTRTFTLKELVRRGNELGPRPAEEPLARWLARAHEGRRPVDLLGASVDDDIGDPTEDRLLDHRSTALEIDELLAEVVDLLWPPPA